MFILLNRVIGFNGKEESYQVFDTETGEDKILKSYDNCYYLRDISNYPTRSWCSDNIFNPSIIVLGYTIIGEIRYFIISLGSTKYYLMRYDCILVNCERLTNAYFSYKYKLIFGSNIELQDLSNIFPEQSFEYIGTVTGSQIGSVGMNEKFIGKQLGTDKLGVVKFPLQSSNGFTDCKNEVICYELGKLFGVPCCEVIEGKVNGRDCIMSVYEYNPYKEDIISFNKALIKLGYTELNISALIEAYGEDFRKDYYRVVAFDYVTCQGDRHNSNLSILNGRVYPLFDNGNSLNFGISYNRYEGNYKYILRTMPADVRSSLLNKGITRDDISEIFYNYYNEKEVDCENVITTVYNRYTRVMGGNF